MPTGALIRPETGLPPLGRALEIRSSDHRCVVAECGATLWAYEVGGRPVVEPFAGPGEAVTGCQGQILAPWPNRIVDGRWSWQGTEYQLSLTEPERNHALHGLVRSLTWQVTEHVGDRVQMEVLLLAHPGWPFPLHVSASYALDTEGLTSMVTATNVGRRACPYGAAVHPYLALPGCAVDDAVLHMAAATWQEADHRLAPTRLLPTTGSPYDFSAGAPIGDRVVDNAFTDLVVGAGGRVEASLRTADGCTTTMWGDATVRWWQLFTGDVLPAPWRRRTLALEPMTCGPDALNSGRDLVVLEPGESHTMTWGLTLS